MFHNTYALLTKLHFSIVFYHFRCYLSTISFISDIKTENETVSKPILPALSPAQKVSDISERLSLKEKLGDTSEDENAVSSCS